MAKLSEVTGNYKCDDCPATFKASEVELQLLGNGLSMTPLFSTIRLIASDGTIVGVGSTDNANKGDQVMCCPKCHKVHLFGFNRS